MKAKLIQKISRLTRNLKDNILRAWYIKGQEWYAMDGEISFADELPKSKRIGFLMGYNAAKYVAEHNMQPASLGTVTWIKGRNR